MKVDIHKLRHRLGEPAFCLWRLLLDHRDDNGVCTLTKASMAKQPSFGNLTSFQVESSLKKLRKAGLVTKGKATWISTDNRFLVERNVKGALFNEAEVDVPTRTYNWLGTARNWGGSRRRRGQNRSGLVASLENQLVETPPNLTGSSSQVEQDIPPNLTGSSSQVEQDIPPNLTGSGSQVEQDIPPNLTGIIKDGSGKGSDNPALHTPSPSKGGVAKMTGDGVSLEDDLTHIYHNFNKKIKTQKNGIWVDKNQRNSEPQNSQSIENIGSGFPPHLKNHKNEKSNHWEISGSFPKFPNDSVSGKNPQEELEVSPNPTASTREGEAFSSMDFGSIFHSGDRSEEESGKAAILRSREWRSLRRGLLTEIKNSGVVPRLRLKDGKTVPDFIMRTPYPPRTKDISDESVLPYLVTMWSSLIQHICGREDKRMHAIAKAKKDTRKRDAILAWWRACDKHRVRPLDWAYWALNKWEAQGHKTKVVPLDGVLSSRRVLNNKERHIFKGGGNYLGGRIRRSEIGKKIIERFGRLDRRLELLLDDSLGSVEPDQIKALVDELFPAGLENATAVIQEEHQQCVMSVAEVEIQAKRGEFIWVPPWA